MLSFFHFFFFSLFFYSSALVVSSLSTQMKSLAVPSADLQISLCIAVSLLVLCPVNYRYLDPNLRAPSPHLPYSTGLCLESLISAPWPWNSAQTLRMPNHSVHLVCFSCFRNYYPKLWMSQCLRNHCFIDFTVHLLVFFFQVGN